MEQESLHKFHEGDFQLVSSESGPMGVSLRPLYHAVKETQGRGALITHGMSRASERDGPAKNTFKSTKPNPCNKQKIAHDSHPPSPQEQQSRK
jgi:hypothetical protein